jgi:biopolymer transport protein ExbD
MLKKTRRIGISIDMTPFVDIAFLLLIFFMATTQFDPPDAEKIALPESSSEAKVPESRIITIAVTAAPRVKVEYHRGTEKVATVLNPGNLKADFETAIANARAAAPAARMVVKMDKDAPYGVMADLMPALQKANAPRFNVVTDLKISGGAGAFRH